MPVDAASPAPIPKAGSLLPLVVVGELVEAAKFTCLLVSRDPKEYLYGIVPFDFKRKTAAQQAHEKFKAKD